MGKKIKELNVAEIKIKGQIGRLRVSSNGRDLIIPATGDKNEITMRSQDSVIQQLLLSSPDLGPYARMKAF